MYTISHFLFILPTYLGEGMGGRVRAGGGGKAAVATEHQKSSCGKNTAVYCRLSVSQTSERFLPKVNNVALCILIIKSVKNLNRPSFDQVMTSLMKHDFVVLAEI